MLDDENNTVLRLSGDARLVIEYMPFESDFTASGKTFEFELATSDVKNYETRIMECLDGADSVTYSQGYAGEDTRQNKFRVKEIDSDKFIEKLKHAVGRIVNAPTKDIRTEHEKQRNRLIGIAEKLERELQIETYR